MEGFSNRFNNVVFHETVTTRFSLPGHKVEFGLKNKYLEVGRVTFNSPWKYVRWDLNMTLPASRDLFFEPNSTLWPGSENRVVTVSWSKPFTRCVETCDNSQLMTCDCDCDSHCELINVGIDAQR